MVQNCQKEEKQKLEDAELWYMECRREQMRARIDNLDKTDPNQYREIAEKAKEARDALAALKSSL